MGNNCSTARFEPEPNSDVSGVGVLVGFMGTAYLTIVVLTAYYFLAFQPRRDPYSSRHNLPPSTDSIVNDSISLMQEQTPAVESNSRDGSLTPRARFDQDHLTFTTEPGDGGNHWTANPINVFILENRLARWALPRPNLDSAMDGLDVKVEKAFRRYMLSSCDIQMVTGLGIIISAFATLGGPSGISAYHWQIVVYLAWFANMSPLLGLTFLRRYLQRNPLQRTWRLIFRGVLFVLLLVALFPTAYFDWKLGVSGVIADPGFFARCFFDLHFVVEQSQPRGEIFGVSAGTMVLSMVVLAFTCAARMIKMSRRAARRIKRNVRGRAREFGVRMINHVSKGLQTPKKHPRLDALRISLVIEPMASLLLTARLYADFYASTASDIWWAWSTAAWVTIRIFQAKASAQVDEGDLTFGQSMAVLLLVAPTVTAGITLWKIFPQWIGRQRKQEHRSVDNPVFSQNPTRRQEPVATANISGDDEYNVPSRQLVLPSPLEEPSGDRRVCHALDLVKCNPKSYMQQCSSAVIVLLWCQTWLATFSFLWLAMNGFYGSSVDFLLHGSISACLQALNCSLLTLLGMRKAVSKHQEKSRNDSRTRVFIWLFLGWNEGIVVWTLLVLGFVIFLMPTMPFVPILWFPYHPVVFLIPWGLYAMYAFIEAMVSPAR